MVELDMCRVGVAPSFKMSIPKIRSMKRNGHRENKWVDLARNEIIRNVPGLPSSGLSTVGLVRCSNQRVNRTAEGLGPVTIRN